MVHCASQQRAEQVPGALTARLEQAGLALHPGKTKIVYCRDGNRRGTFGCTSFTFPGCTFRPRASRDRQGRTFTAFLPAISADALKRISRAVRHWRLHRRICHTWEELAAGISPIVAGWMQYCGRFCRSALYRLLARISACLVRWIRNKYRRLAGVRASRRRSAELAQATPALSAQWQWVRTAW